jgi:DNA primase
LIVEGESDLVAALDLGFAAIGRPNCNSCVDMTADFVKGREVVIIGDNDDGGRFGVERLSDTLVLYCKDIRIVYPPEGIKDLRDWLRIGLAAEKLRGIIGNTKPVRIRISFNGK